jgi:hypothetical protein
LTQEAQRLLNLPNVLSQGLQRNFRRFAHVLGHAVKGNDDGKKP